VAAPVTRDALIDSAATVPANRAITLRMERSFEGRASRCLSRDTLAGMPASIANDSLTEVRSTLTQAPIIAAARKPRMKRRNQEDTGRRVADPEASTKAGFPASMSATWSAFTPRTSMEERCHRALHRQRADTRRVVMPAGRDLQPRVYGEYARPWRKPPGSLEEVPPGAGAGPRRVFEPLRKRPPGGGDRQAHRKTLPNVYLASFSPMKPQRVKEAYLSTA
jgi:hypothetical protein